VTCALILTVCIPALANTSKSLSDCTTFVQSEKGDDALTLSVSNSCKVPVDCSVKWRVVCAPDAKKRRAVHEKSSKFTLAEGTAQTTEASAAVCGDDTFAIDHIEWGCEPNKD
jgi:hypothetical protein